MNRKKAGIANMLENLLEKAVAAIILVVGIIVVWAIMSTAPIPVDANTKNTIIAAIVIGAVLIIIWMGGKKSIYAVV